MGDFVNLDEMRNIASMPWSANMFYVDNYTLWEQLVPELVGATCDSTSLLPLMNQIVANCMVDSGIIINSKCMDFKDVL